MALRNIFWGGHPLEEMSLLFICSVVLSLHVKVEHWQRCKRGWQRCMIYANPKIGIVTTFLPCVLSNIILECVISKNVHDIVLFAVYKLNMINRNDIYTYGWPEISIQNFTPEFLEDPFPTGRVLPVWQRKRFFQAPLLLQVCVMQSHAAVHQIGFKSLPQSLSCSYLKQGGET
jgi:hypothetical protein